MKPVCYAVTEQRVVVANETELETGSFCGEAEQESIA